MSRRLLLALVLAVVATATLRAQTAEDRQTTELRVLLGRLDAQLADLAVARARAEQATRPQRTARVVVSGGVALVLWTGVPDSLAHALAHRADSALRRSGVIPGSFTSELVFVMRDAADTAAALSDAGLADRRRVELNVALPLQRVDDWWVLGPLLSAYAASLDSTWADWTQNAWGFVRWPDRAAERGGKELLAAAWDVADRCLAGDPAGCRRFLGLDTDAHPYRVRFTPAERRRLLEGYWGGYRGILACRNGDDDACVRVLETTPFTGMGGIPAGGDTRAGLLASMAAMHGPAAVRTALADREGSVGERLARAAGISVDSLAMEWRAWALAGGRPYHVRAGLGDLLAAALIVGILVSASTRSQPWT
jgi:hypothetical protein